MRATLVRIWLFVALCGSGLAAAQTLEPPRPLACYKRYYGLDSELRAGRWYLKLTSGEALLYDDGAQKNAEQRIAHPDVEDQFADFYRSGSMTRETQIDRDPGRVRVMAILRSIYGSSGAVVDAELKPIDWFGTRLRVHRRIAPALLRVRARLEAAIAADKTLRPWLDRPAGCFADRRIAGTDRKSPHAFAIACDIDPKRSEYWRWDGERGTKKSADFLRPLPPALVAAFESEGFIWGGRWYHYDTMHFEFRPELLDEKCAP